MKKIAILGPNLENRGGVNVVINHLRNYLKKKYEVHLFPVGKTGIKESEFIHPVNSNAKKEQLKILKEKFFDVDLAIANNLRTHYLLSRLNFKNDLYVFHQGAVIQKKNLFTSLKQKIKFKKIYEGKRVVFLNECFKNEFLKRFRVNLEYKIIPNPFDFDEIRKKAGADVVEGEYILSVGRLTKGKNLEFVINAYKKGGFKEELWILGDGEERENLERVVKELNLAGKVRFLGWKENPYPYIKNAKLLVHSSKFEALPSILIEALILNTPVVATDIKCGPSEILTGRLGEFLVSLNEEEVLIDKMKNALLNYPEIKEEYIQKFKVENVAREYEKFL